MASRATCQFYLKKVDIRVTKLEIILSLLKPKVKISEERVGASTKDTMLPGGKEAFVRRYFKQAALSLMLILPDVGRD